MWEQEGNNKRLAPPHGVQASHTGRPTNKRGVRLTEDQEQRLSDTLLSDYSLNPLTFLKIDFLDHSSSPNTSLCVSF